MNDLYTMHDFWLNDAHGNVRVHYEHYDDELTVPDTYVKTVYINCPNGTREVHSKLISRSEYMYALNYALNH